MDKWLKIFLIFLVIIIIIAIILLVVFRDHITTTGKNLAKQSKEELHSKGYGTTYKAYESPCITNDGKCNTAGIKYITEYCQPHPVSGNGCINENGEMTYNAQTRNEICKPTCRAYIFQEDTSFTNICQYDAPYNQPAYTCVPSNAQMYEYRKLNCVKNDSIGDNTCTYKCNQSGVDSAGLAGDVDPYKLSYIPACAANQNQTISLNSFNWNNILNIANDPSKGVLSKGYTITNLKLENGKVNPKLFGITPAYPPWSANPSNVISYEDLLELDSSLIVYQNCITAAKPQCSSYYYAKPIEIGSDLTYQRAPTLCTLDTAFTPIKECFYHPWNNTPGEFGSSGINFVNPYTGGASGPESVGGTGAVYSWSGIGNYGYYYTPLTCENSAEPFKPGPTGTYIIPENDPNIQCLNLTAPPKQCAVDLSDIFSVVPSQNLETLIKNYEPYLNGQTGPYTTPVLTTYPQVAGTTNYMCSTRYTNNITTSSPACVQTCQYLPSSNNIDFNAKDINGNYLDSNFQDLLGKYIYFNIDISGEKYFLATQNIPCKNTSNEGVPLMNCVGSSGTAYLPTPCAFIYGGGTGIDAGNYWSKSGCDEEAIQMTTSLAIIVSPSRVINTIGSGNTGTQILCDLYGYINGTFGYLSPNDVPTGGISVPSLDISSYFYNYSATSGNIVANTLIGAQGSKIYFNALEQGQEIPSGTNGNVPSFIISYDDSTKIFSVRGSNPFLTNDLYVDTYNGVSYNNNFITFQFTREVDKIPNVPYYFHYNNGFNEPLIKPSGIFSGEDVSRTIVLQRINPCYNKATCQSGFTGPCFQNTCNLYFTYSPEFC